MVASCDPRMMLPPPITTPTEAPVSMTPWSSSANLETVSKSNPNPFPPASASPESFSRTRGYLRSAMRSDFSQLVTDEATDLDVFAGLGRDFLHEVADTLLRLA